ncbi:MAG: pantetheine-phosphate adenylyltransferase [Tepidiformaceae bacterium]
MTVAIYAGSFDPITNGHVAIIRSGLVAFEKIVVAGLNNPNKTSLFSVDERLEMIREAFPGDDRLEVDQFEGLLVHYCQARGVRVVLRGLRAVADFEQEIQMANMNRHMSRDIETFFVMAADYFFVSSSHVKEAASLGGRIEGTVPDGVAARLRAKFAT